MDVGASVQIGESRRDVSATDFEIQAIFALIASKF
jgi:hypothetical protein